VSDRSRAEAVSQEEVINEVIRLMRASLPRERHDHVATSVIVKARKPPEPSD
jgi:hypothetical protein